MDAMRSVVYRLYPTRRQEKKFNLFRCAVGDTFNHVNAYCRDLLSKGEKIPGEYELGAISRNHMKETPWMAGVASRCITNVGTRIKYAYENYFTKLKLKMKAGFPRFKTDSRMDSFTYTNNGGFWFATEKDKVPNLRYMWLGNIGFVKYRNDLRFPGIMKTATVFRRKEGNYYNWYVSIVYEMKDYAYQETSLERHKSSIGIDMGLECLIATSDGEMIDVEHSYNNKSAELSKLYCKLVKTERDSVENKKNRAKQSHIFKKIRNRRSDFNHKISRKLVFSHDFISMEDLHVREMIDKSYTAIRKNLYRDASWSILRNMISYKAEEAGCDIIEVPAEHTSQMCSRCGTMIEKEQKERIHVCWNCGLIMDRDINAAKNILSIGLRLQAVIKSKRRGTGNSLRSRGGI